MWNGFFATRTRREAGHGHGMPSGGIPGAPGFELVSREPLVFVWRQFASERECEALAAHGEAARGFAGSASAQDGCSEAQIAYGVEGFRRVVQMNGKLYAEVASVGDGGDTRLCEAAQALVERFNCASAAFLGHAESPHDEQWQSVVNCTPGVSAHWAGAARLLQGVHVDTYNDSAPRFATSLLYLRCPPHGCETLFASDVAAGAALLERGVESTLEDAAARIRVAATGRNAMHALEASAHPLVPASAGTLLLFFVRGPSGAVCPASFHGSARPAGGDKWTLQTFWAAPPDADVECYARERVAHVLSRLPEGDHAPLR